MQDDLLVADGPAQLSQVTRVVDTFVAPRKTFTDILRSAACWLPLVLVAIMSIGYAATVDKKVGFAAVMEQQMAKNPKAEERMSSLAPEQRAKTMSMQAKGVKVTSYVGFLFAFIFFAIEALILWASFNFALGAQTTFPQVFAVVSFAALPRALLMTLLSIVLLLAGVGTENFDMRNPVGTNVGYYLSTSPQWMQTAGGFLDVFGIWSLVLLSIGMAVIARKSLSQGFAVVFGWWALILVIVTGFSAAFS